MSTDYGLKCIDDCHSFIPDNGREYDAIAALKGKHQYAALYEAYEAANGISAVSIFLTADLIPYEFTAYIEWLALHHNHNLKVVDEYGRTYTLLENGKLERDPEKLGEQ